MYKLIITTKGEDMKLSGCNKCCFVSKGKQRNCTKPLGLEACVSYRDQPYDGYYTYIPNNIKVL